MLADFEEGHGVMWSSGVHNLYGVVIGNHGYLDVVPVLKATQHTRCYDEGGSDYDIDRHKVRLRDCPPPFTLLYAFIEFGCYVDADIDSAYRFSEDDIAIVGMHCIDDGCKISDRDMSTIKDHPWRDEKQFAQPSMIRFSEPVPETERVAVQAVGGAMSRLMASIAMSDAPGKDEEYDGPEL